MFTIVNTQTDEVVGQFIAFNEALNYFIEVLKLKKSKLNITSNVKKDDDKLIVTYNLGLDNWKIVQEIGE